MRSPLRQLAAFAFLAACGAPVRDVPLVHVVATAELGCANCTTQRLTVAPHCGFDVRPLDGGTIEVTSTIAPKDVAGVLVIDERLLTPGAAEPLVQRRAVFANGPSRVFPAFPSAAPALYDVDATGELHVLLDSGTLDGGVAQFRYDVTLTDGGAASVLETHAVDAITTQRAAIEDHSGDPFYGCCESAGPGSLAPALLALLGLRRRLARRPRL